MNKDVALSKFLSYVLRHKPDEVGLTPDAGGWVEIEVLCAAAPDQITSDDIRRVVAGSDKQRFEISSDGTRIRANQGHSFPVSLGLTPANPPDTLYHGTHKEAVASILEQGLRPMQRQHVHLSPDISTARKVGERRGPPVILRVDTGKAHVQGQVFFRSDNGVWLTRHVAPHFLAEIE